MPISVTMPQLGESVTEGTVTRWLKNVGDMVVADEPLLEVSTDKVDTEIPAPASGVLLSIAADVDATVPVGAELAVIGDANEASQDAPAPAAPAAAPAAPAAPAASGASVAILLPALGESVTEGTVTRWLKNVGDAIAVDEPILEISTDKVDTELPSPAAGILTEITVNVDDTAPVGAQLGVISTGAAAPAAAPVPPAPAPAAATTPAPAPAVAPSAPSAPAAPAENADAYVTPLVRRLAAQHGVDLSKVTGTGVGGRIRKQDVLDAAAAPVAPVAPAAPAPSAPTPAASQAAAAPASDKRGRTEKITRLRKVIAERMVESLQTSAQLTTVIEVDLTKIVALRKRVKNDFSAREGVNLTFLPFIAKASIEALKQFPQMNASLNMDEGTVTYFDHENLGIAVDTERGLLVPVIRDAGDLNIAGIARKIADLAARTRDNKVTPEELSDGTFTITNTGSRGALFDTPIVNPPQVAILGTGAIVKRPVVITDDAGQDVIAIRSMMYLALSYDHRLVDGADASRFLGAVRARLEEGAFESELGL